MASFYLGSFYLLYNGNWRLKFSRIWLRKYKKEGKQARERWEERGRLKKRFGLMPTLLRML